MFLDLVAIRWRAITGGYPGNERAVLTHAKARQ
jgi:hypothetical protein